MFANRLTLIQTEIANILSFIRNKCVVVQADLRNEKMDKRNSNKQVLGVSSDDSLEINSMLCVEVGTIEFSKATQF